MNSYILLLLCFLLGIVIYLIVNNTETLSISCEVEPSTIGCGSYMSTPINCSKLVYYDKHYRNALILKNDIFGLSKLKEFTDIKDNNNPIFYDDTLDSLVPYITNQLHNKRSTYTDFNYNLEAKYFDENGCPTVNAYPSTWEDFISQTNKAMSQILITIKNTLGNDLDLKMCEELFNKNYMNMKPEYITTIEEICYREFKKLKFRYFNRGEFGSHFVYTKDRCNLRYPYRLFSMNTTDSLFKFIENGTNIDYYNDETNYHVNSAGVIELDQSFIYSSEIMNSINIILLNQICANKYMKETFVPANSCKVNVQKTINNIYNNYNTLHNSSTSTSISNNGTPEKIMLNEYIENLESKTCEVHQDLGKCLPSDISDTLLSCQVDPTICEHAGGQYDISDNQCKCPKSLDDNSKYSCPSSDKYSSDIFKLNKLEKDESCLFPVGIRGEFNYGCNNDLICETERGFNNYGRCISSESKKKLDMKQVAEQVGCDYFEIKTPIDLFRCGKALQVLEEVTEVDEGLVLLDEVPVAGEVLMAGEVVSEGAALANAGIKCHNVLSDVSHLETLIDKCGIDNINKKVQELENIYTKDSSESSGFL